MTFTIGRFTAPSDPYAVEMDGDRVTFGLHLIPTVSGDDDHLHALRQQLLGLVNNEDEEVVPVTWSADATFDGFYRPVSVSVPTSDILIRDAIVLNCTVTLERLTGYASAQYEVINTNVVKTNGHSVTTPAGRVAVPATSYGAVQKSSSTGQGPNNTDVSTATGTIDVFGGAPATFPLAALTYSCGAGDLYDGACLIEVKYGSTWYAVSGRDLGTLATFTNLRISNGLVRLTPSSTNLFGIEVWTGAAWEAATESFQVYSTYAAAVVAGSGPWSVLRNSPESCVVAINGDSGSGIPPAITFGITRGVFVVDVTVKWPTAAISTEQWVLQASSNTGATSITGGIVRTSDDASGNRWFLVGAPALTKDTTNGKITTTAASPSASFGIGMEYNGTGTAAFYQETVNADIWFTASSQRQRAIVK